MARRSIGAIALFLLAMAGVGLLIAGAQIPAEIVEKTGLSEQALRLVSVLNNAIIVGVAVLIGALTAHRVGLHSLIAHPKDGAGARLAAFPIYLALGVAMGLALTFVDQWAFAHIPALRELAAAGSQLAGVAPSVAVRFLYGGITEEVLLRWGVLSFFAWIIFAMTKNRGLAFWIAIPLAALLFGVGHLPALYASLETVPMEMIVRVITFNAVLALAYGVIYMRNSLEAAMAAHAATHVGMLAAAHYIL